MTQNLVFTPPPYLVLDFIYYYYSIICNFMGFCSPQLLTSIINSKITAIPHSLAHRSVVAVRIARPVSCGSPEGAEGFGPGAVWHHAAASRPRNSLRFCALSPPAQRLLQPSFRPAERASLAQEAGSALPGLASAAGGRRRERRAEAGEEAGLRRAVAGAERGGRAAGTRLAPLAASAHTSAPQPRASPALGFGVCGRRPWRNRRNPGRAVR